MSAGRSAGLVSTRVDPPQASGDAPLSGNPSVRVAIGTFVLVGVAYYLSARLGLTLSLVEHNVTPLWPPTGVAVAAFLLVGRNMWPAVAMAALAVNVPISESLVAAATTAIGNTMAPLVAVTLLMRFGFRRQLDRLRDALAIVFLGALVSMLISATVGAGTLVVSGAISSDELPSAWAVWWTGDAMGVLAVAPFLLALPLFWERRDWSWSRWAECSAIMVTVACVSVWASVSGMHVLFLVLLVLGWAAWRLQLRGAAPAALIASLVATWSAAHERGPFQQESLSEQMLTLQAFNASVALTSFVLAAMVSERLRAAEALRLAAVELEDRVERRTAELSAANARLLQEIHDRSEAQEQLLLEEARAEREHKVAETLQRSLLPDRLPVIAGVTLAARYVPATSDVEVGGDWYDVIPLPDGMIGLAIGDVAGHGLQAAATMGQLRMALRAYAMQDPSPVPVMRGVHQLMSQLPVSEMATLIYLVFDPATRRVRFANAGHPPALVIGNGSTSYLADGLAPPVGVTADDMYVEVAQDLEAGCTLLLYTDGLVERRGVSIQDGLDQLRLEAGQHETSDLEELCDRLLAVFVEPSQVADDVALVAMRPVSVTEESLALSLPAEPRMLAQARRTLRQWLRESAVAPTDENEIVIACGEACANVVQHAYGRDIGVFELEARLVGAAVEVSVRDHGEWRAPTERGGGWGLSLMRSLMDSVLMDRSPVGTTVTMRRRVELGGRG